MTAVSTLCTDTLLFTYHIASPKWRTMWVSASLWVHAVRPNSSSQFAQSTPVLCVMLTWNKNSSILLLSMQSNSCQVYPLLLRVSTFKLSGKYTSQTMSNLQACYNCEVMSGTKHQWQNSGKSSNPGSSMLIVAAPSRMLTSTVRLERFSFTGVSSSKLFSKSDLFRFSAHPSVIMMVYMPNFYA